MRSAVLSLVVAVICVAVLWVRFNAPPPETGQLYPHDLLYSYYPKVELLGERLAAGELPLWNPAGCAGMPLLAGIQNGVLYPPMWVSAVLDPGTTLAWLTLSHLLFAAAGAALLFRRWRAPPILAGALAGVFVYAAGLGQTFWPPQVFAIAWMPWVLLCVEGALEAAPSDRSSRRDPRRNWWLALVAATALQLLAGFPQYVVYTLQLAAPLTALRVFQLGTVPDAVSGVARVALAFALGAGVAGVQLVPTAELFLESERREALSERDAQYLQDEARLGTLVENAVTPAPRMTAFELGTGAGYLGIGALVLAAVALVLERRRALAWGLLASGLLFLFLSDGHLGAARSVFDLYASLPLIGSFRSPERLLVLVVLAFVGLAALGASSLESKPRRERVLGVAAAVLAASAIGAFGGARAGLLAAGAAGVVAVALFVPVRPALRVGWQVAAAVLLLGDVALSTGAFGSLRHFPAGWAETYHVGGRAFMSAADAEQQRARVGDGRVSFFGRGLNVRPIAGAGPLRAGRRLACYETPVPRAWQALARLVDGGDYRSAIGTNVDPHRFDTLLDLASVREVNRIVAPRVPSLRSPNRVFARHASPLPGLPRGARLSTEINADALPRAYLVGDYRVEPLPPTLIRVARGGFDYRSQVLLDRDPQLPVGRIGPLQRVALRVDLPERVEMATEADASALLVLTDTYYPGWQVSVDGQPAEILRANGLFRAIALSPGRHQVVFEYAPGSLRWGAGLSLMSLVVAVAIRMRS